MKNQQLITKIENEIKTVQETIANYEQQLTNYKNTLFALAQQLTQIKLNNNPIDTKKNIT